MTANKTRDTHDCRVCKHRVKLGRMVVCELKTMGEDPRILDRETCEKYEYKFESQEK